MTDLRVQFDSRRARSRIQRMEARTVPALREASDGLARDIVPIMERHLIAHTPVGKGTPTGNPAERLYRTTTGGITRRGTNAVSTQSVAWVKQTKRVGGRQWLLSELLDKGHRIVTRSGVDTGRRTEPLNYFEAARRDAQPEIETAMHRWADRIPNLIMRAA